MINQKVPIVNAAVQANCTILQVICRIDSMLKCFRAQLLKQKLLLLLFLNWGKGSQTS